MLICYSVTSFKPLAKLLNREELTDSRGWLDTRYLRLVLKKMKRGLRDFDKKKVAKAFFDKLKPTTSCFRSVILERPTGRLTN